MNLQFNLQAAKQRCVVHRKKILELSLQVPALHIGPAFSCLEMVDVIYHDLMRKNSQGECIDTFVLSKGHGCAVQYIVLHGLGILSDDDIKNFCLPGGRLGAHPDYGLPGIAASTGSLGHGLGLSVGMAYANRLNNQDIKNYVVISDGELQEGSTWEAIMMAANLKLNNLTVLLDLNDRTSLEKLSQGHPAFYPVTDKLTAFNWQVSEVDGHDASAVFEAAQNQSQTQPNFIICHTKKGKGVSYMEDVAIWHYRSPNEKEYQQALNELAAVEA
ncbi:MAG: transketolase [Gammaproteobacteria bacterium]|nr:transketolase [Gammaproteobacteria bacterium]